MFLLAVVTLTACIPAWEAPIKPEEEPDTALPKRPYATHEWSKRKFDTEGDGLASIVVPAEGLYGTSFAFVGTDGNVRFRLEAHSWETTGGSRADGELLAAAATLIAMIRERLTDPDLSQSPAPTVRGYSDVLEETPILEACAALDRGVFESSTGLPQTAPVERRTPPFDLTVRDEHDRYEPTAACTRTYSAGLRPDAAQAFQPSQSPPANMMGNHTASDSAPTHSTPAGRRVNHDRHSTNSRSHQTISRTIIHQGAISTLAAYRKNDDAIRIIPANGSGEIALGFDSR